ncbi:Hypothetical protein HVR_LOCUS547 [uncultured virus]|nr:Hypothetical protein HVR_LOCUS547 [uncultured virus]
MSYTFEYSESLGNYNNIRNFINIYIDGCRLVSLEVNFNKDTVPICIHITDIIDGKQVWDDIYFTAVSPDYGAHINFGLIKRDEVKYIQIFEGYRSEGTVEIIIPFNKCDKKSLKQCLNNIISAGKSQK